MSRKEESAYGLLWEMAPEEEIGAGGAPVPFRAEAVGAEATLDDMDQRDLTPRPLLSFPSLSSLAVPPMEGTERPPCHDRMAALRQLLAEKYPAAERRSGGILPTGLAPVDAVEGGLRRAALTELSGSSGGGALFLQAMLGAVNREKCLAALVDAARSFDPEGCPPSALARLLLVLCVDAAQAVKAADLLLRDGNLSLVLLDLQSAPFQQIRRIHASAWHRLQRLVEQTASALVVLTPQPMVEGARVRIALQGSWTLSAQRRWRHELVSEMPARVYLRHSALGGAELESRKERAGLASCPPMSASRQHPSSGSLRRMPDEADEMPVHSVSA